MPADREPVSRHGEPLVGRGGLKLRAAVERFGLDAAIRDAHAVDIGSSTGGFAEVLLQRGARAVQCVDVGRDQLHPRLRRDPRVSVREQADWKQLPLSELPGPYDFFTIDVSFVAARNMLRGLAFRLRPGAQGVVLVKPQFELPDRLAGDGQARDADRRRLALRRFTQKAETLGFRVIGDLESPVKGGSGTVEVLTHLRFVARPAGFPLPPGQQEPPGSPESPGSPARNERAYAPRRKRAAPAAERALGGDSLRWFAVVAPGAETVAAREASQVLGAAGVAATEGGVEITGPLGAGMSANLWLRVPTRILLRVGEAKAREFGPLRYQLARLPWEAFAAAGAPVRISVSTSRCRLYHTGAIEETVRAAIGDRLGRAPAAATASSEHAAAIPAMVLVRGVGDIWTISIDSSGERLHRRGWRIEAGKAPLRESLAAALLALADWRPTEALIDPMCGAGTIAIEACLAALGTAPGLGRGFAFEAWPALSDADRDRWQEQRRRAEGARRSSLPAAIVASDRDAAAVASARRNAARAGLEGDAAPAFAQRTLAETTPPAPSGLLITNPPYGRRLGQRQDLPKLYREMGRVLATRFSGWRAAVVTPDARLASAFRVPVTASHTILHGGKRVTLLCLASQ